MSPTEVNHSVHPEIAQTAATMLRLPLRDRRKVLILAQALLAAQNQPGPTDTDEE